MMLSRGRRMAPLPEAKLYGVYEDLTSQTVYTFANCQIGPLGSSGSFQDGNQIGQGGAHVRTGSRNILCVCIHAENATATFDVSSVTLGGVAVAQRADRGGLTTAINTAVFAQQTSSFDTITNTDIVVTFSEAVDNCVIGVVMLEHTAGFLNSGSQTNSQTGNIDVALTQSNGQPFIILAASSCVTGGGTERFSATCLGLQSNLFEPTLLYEGNNAAFDYAACFAVCTARAVQDASRIRLTWSGTGFGDAAYTMFEC